MRVFNRYNRVSPGGINFATAIDRTRQEFKDECDVNNIVDRFAATGSWPQPFKSPPMARYGDYSTAPDYFEALLAVNRAQEQFASLPAKVRDRFNNEPGQLLAFLDDPANKVEAQALGLLKDVLPSAPATPPTPSGITVPP